MAYLGGKHKKTIMSRADKIDEKNGMEGRLWMERVARERERANEMVFLEKKMMMSCFSCTTTLLPTSFTVINLDRENKQYQST